MAWAPCGAWCDTQQVSPPFGLAGHGQDGVALHRHAGQALADHRDLGDGVGALEGVDVVAERGGEADVGAVLGEQDRARPGASAAAAVVTAGSGS